MPIAAFANLGCKVNQYETDKMIESFAERGFEIAGFDQPADIYVINSCSVTGAADRKSRHMARRASRQKAGARVVVTGCFAQLAIDTGEVVDGAALLVPNREKMRVAELALDAFPELGGTAERQARTSAGLPAGARSIAVFPEQAESGLIRLDNVARPASPLPMRHTHTRDTLKVQDGCRHFCAFCSIPYTRDTMASRGLDAVIAEAREMAGRGTREVVVTGVCVGAYRDEASGAGLPELMAAVASVPGLERVRLSSLQPIETDEALIGVLARYPAVCPHLHLSLQSGDDTVLKLMQRPYDTAYYRALVSRLRTRVPGIAITTDIIVGFPGETRALFENTLAFAEEIGFARAHVFRYSPRERTYAEREFKDDVAPQEKERRHKELSEVCRRTQSDFAAQLIGKEVDILVEGRGREAGWMAGYTDTYVRVHVPGGREIAGTIMRVRVGSVTEDGDAVAGEPIRLFEPPSL